MTRRGVVFFLPFVNIVMMLNRKRSALAMFYKVGLDIEQGRSGSFSDPCNVTPSSISYFIFSFTSFLGVGDVINDVSCGNMKEKTTFHPVATLASFKL